jgi:hypothetical protein
MAMLRNVVSASPVKVAEALAQCGFFIAKLSVGDEMEDGELCIGPIVCVQVPTFGGAPRVVSGTFHAEARCYPPRTTIADLAHDIRDALNDAPSAALGGCSIH